MEGFNPFMLFYIFLVLSNAMSASMAENLGAYIIHMDKSAMPMAFSSHHDWYLSTLSSISSSDGVLPTHLYTYNHVLNGFSAVLSREHLDQLEKIPGFLATHADTFGHLHTTRSPRFLGLDENAGAWPEGNFGEDTIIGIIDTGIWPESESFKDKGLGPVPDRWRGACESGVAFNSSYCNRKLIGARSFSKGLKQQGFTISTPDDFDSPRDSFGHGTHTASTAAGSPVRDASYFGYAKGTAIGIAPKARLAAYKVLFDNDTDASAATDTLAGIDQAIADGVDVMSLSLGFDETTFEQNPIAVGSFAAMEKGIFVSCAAGNSGPDGYTMLNGAPWITTIGAGTIDRDYAADVTLGNGVLTIRGRSVYPENMLVSNISLYFGYGNRSKELCEDFALDPAEVAGKIVFCDFNESAGISQRIEVNRTGALGAIISSDSGFFILTGVYFIPLVVMTPKDGDLVKDYIIKSENPVVDIKFLITVLGLPAPQVAFFSSRGPNNRAPMILKPDVLAPGVNILAAWPSNRPVTRVGDHLLLTDYALLSGTSMSSPHAVGVAALLKSAHPDWSPAAIRSALMTTAYLLDNTIRSITDMETGVAATPLDFGAGHISPTMAMDPGLIYDIEVQDYIDFLCGLNYTSKQIKIITRRSKFSCDQANLDLNYPSFMVLLNNNTNTAIYTFKRLLTNVADSPSVYRASLKLPSGMKVKVHPSKVSFAGKYSKAEFNMTVEINLGHARAQSEYIGNYGYLTWLEIDGTHMVRSPIVSAFAL